MGYLSISKQDPVQIWLPKRAMQLGFKFSSVLTPKRNGQFIDAILKISTTTGAGTPTYGPGPLGNAVNFNGSASCDGTQDICAGQTFSRLAIVYPVSLSANRSISTNSAAASQAGPQWRITTAGEMSLLKQNVSSIGTSSGAGIAANKLSFVGLTYDGTIARFFADGRPCGTGSSAQTFTLGSGAIGSGRSAFATEAFSGLIFLHADVANTVLPASTMIVLTRELRYPTRQSRSGRVLSIPDASAAFRARPYYDLTTHHGISGAGV